MRINGTHTALILAVTALLGGAGCVDINSCEKSVDEYCAGTGCAPFEVRLAEMRAEAAQFCFYSAQGVCDDLRFLQSGGGFGGFTEYYDGSGKLVAATVSTDTNAYCGGSSFAQDYGTVPSCIQRVTENLCQTSRLPDMGGRD